MKRGTPKLPVQQFVILSICRFAEPVIFTSVFPYLPEMIRSLGVPKKEVSKWVGFTSAIFSICQCLTAVSWGNLSDRIGRKPIILIGLFVTMTFSIIFGLSKSLPMAILARACIGLGNGNVGIIRTVVAELVPEKELQPRAFSLMPLVWTIGSIFGPAFGGALADPAKRHPEVFGHIEFFKKYPFALPNIAASVFFIIGIVTGFLFLRETLESRKYKRDYGLMFGDMLIGACCGRRTKPKTASPVDDERTPLLNGDRTSRSEIPHQKKSEGKPAKLTWAEILSPQSQLILLEYAALGLHSLAFDSVFPVFLNYPVEESGGHIGMKLPFKFARGFGIDSQAIGILYTLNGIIGMIVQFFIFPYTANRYGVLYCLKITSLGFPLVYALIPFTALFPTDATRQIAAFILLCAKLGCVVFAFPCCTILLTNSAPSVQVLGTLNGVATSVAAIGRAVGPAFIGAVFSIGVKMGYMIFPWWTLAIIGLLSAVPVFWVIETDGFAGASLDDDDGSDDSESEQPYEEAPTSYISGGNEGLIVERVNSKATDAETLRICENAANDSESDHDDTENTRIKDYSSIDDPRRGLRPNN
ncbi:MFS transporter [Coccidioides posadasii str. Silveira]|uniref:MFS transporter n=1 Tax=Coccidioides posadasii (strain RMSCC 757 / Silveira) TaxID=443226 RepID=E9D9F8_COCPS|nr:MFS transporter [Coccidioides posadasii str. Silveira]